MKEIKLSQQGKYKGKYVAQIDDILFDFLNQWKWSVKKDKNNYYAQRCQIIDGKKQLLYLHRFIMETPFGMEVDHKDHNGLNCQKNNMRNCKHRENGLNRRHKTDGTSKYLGVVIRKDYNRILSTIKVNGRAINLGRYETEEMAAKARDIASIHYFGEFAQLNFPELREEGLISFENSNKAKSIYHKLERL